MYLYSIPVLLAEICMALLSHVFLLGMWAQLDRPRRWLADMIPLEDFPAVDMYIVCYTGEQKAQADWPSVRQEAAGAASMLKGHGSRCDTTDLLGINCRCLQQSPQWQWLHIVLGRQKHSYHL